MIEHDALTLASLLRRREVSSVEATRACLARIDEENPRLRAFVEVQAARALRDAEAADRELARRDPDAPLFLGVPTAIKDHELVRFMGMRAGSRAYRYVVSPVDGELTRRVRKAGFVILGKTSCSELTILPFAHQDGGPPTRNPYGLDHYSGGSSSGAAAAVASRMLPIAPGSDGAGSIRLPASFCGLVGIKPGRFTLFHEHHDVDPNALSVVGPLGRTVRDAAAMVDALAGQTRESAPDAFRAAAERAPRPMRIRVATRTPLATVDPEIVRATERAAAALEALGHRVEPGPPLDGTADDFIPVMAKMIASLPSLPFTSHLFHPTSVWMRDAGKRVTLAEAAAAAASLQAKVDAWFGEDVDAWLTPTSAQLAPRVGAYEDMGGEETFRAVVPIGAFTAPFNVSGQPAISVPAGRAGNDLPIGVQLVGHRQDDRRIVSLAAQLEAALG